MPTLDWLPPPSDFRARLQSLETSSLSWPEAVQLAKRRLDFVQTNSLDRVVRDMFAGPPPALPRAQHLRLAILGSSTLSHLPGAIRVGALRRGLWVDTYEGEYGQYVQEVNDRDSGLHRFRPDTVLVALDGPYLSSGADVGLDESGARDVLVSTVRRLETFWSAVKERCGAAIIQQLPLMTAPALLGENEHRVPGSRAAFLRRLSLELRDSANRCGVDVLGVDAWADRDGLRAWHDPVLWKRSKHEVSPVSAPLYGDLVARLLAARQGLSAKCLVLDLDNTLWGGVIGDDGVGGIVLGPGSASGEAYAAFQAYCQDLSRRGVILAVCSKNDEANAFEVFDRHPEMVLKRGDISCFVANWDDKAANLRAIARELNIGCESLVFVDDNPFERELIRRELPIVEVPELPDDPVGFAETVARAGYFESLGVTNEDRGRSAQYQANRERSSLRGVATDMASYLAELDMRLFARPFDLLGLQRIVQLANKTNQFNLMTRRYSEAEIRHIVDNDEYLSLQIRLTDRFGDNGVVAIIIGQFDSDRTLRVETWLMSCRVLGRDVERASFNVLARRAAARGSRRIVGSFRPTAKNEIVRDLYMRLGFVPSGETVSGEFTFCLDLDRFVEFPTFMSVDEGDDR